MVEEWEWGGKQRKIRGKKNEIILQTFNKMCSVCETIKKEGETAKRVRIQVYCMKDSGRNRLNIWIAPFAGTRREKRQADRAHMTETRKGTNQVWMCEEVRSTNKMK